MCDDLATRELRWQREAFTNLANKQARLVAEQLNKGEGPLQAAVKDNYVQMTRMGRCLVLIPVQFKDANEGSPFNLSIWVR